MIIDVYLEILKFLNVEYLANFVTCTCPIRVKGGREGPRVIREHCSRRFFHISGHVLASLAHIMTETRGVAIGLEIAIDHSSY